MSDPPGSSHRFETRWDAVLFDLDGVVTNTAVIHSTAWKQLFDGVLNDPRAGIAASDETFDPGDDYHRYVDGRAREDGVSAFLSARGLALPAGEDGDPPTAWTVAGLAARKNELFLAELRRRGVQVYPGTAALLQRLRDAGLPVGLVTSSRNARAVIEAGGLTGSFDVVVDGDTAAAGRLPGKPDPAVFLEAARRLGVAPSRAVVVEDAIAGVEAGRRGGFGLVVGIDRSGMRGELESAGADVVLDDVGELDLGASTDDPWLLVYDGFDPAHEGHREALTAVGNGYAVTRGARPEYRDDGVHYPGTYLAGVYNRLVSTIHGRDVEDEHMVNTPNWLPVDLRIAEGPWLSSGVLHSEGDRRELDLRRGVVTRRTNLVDPDGRRAQLAQRTFFSMHDPHLAVLETTVTAHGWSGPITLRAGVDAGVRNANVTAYLGSDSTHLTPPTFRHVGDTTVCEVATRQSGVRVATAVRVGLDRDAQAADPADTGSSSVREFRLDLEDGVPVTLVKFAAIFTSRDRAITEPSEAAQRRLDERAGDVDGRLEEHARAWHRLWDQFAVRIAADRQSQSILNLHVFHLLQSISPHTAELDAGVPARGLHGEGYRGHVFWDEVFVVPTIAMRRPEVSRALLDYRWRRLDTARARAVAAGLAGAMFPWQSGSDGRDETPDALYNTRAGRWMPDNSHLQRHVGLAVAYNAWQHYQATGDQEWLAQRGAELIIEVTRFFDSLAQYDVAADRFHIAGVMGPDEFHDGPPEAPGTGLRDNTYTNVLVSWAAARSVEMLEEILEGHDADRLRDRLGVTADEVARWKHLSTRLAIRFHRDGILAQFDGYEDLDELDWERYRNQYGNIGRLDLILESEDDSVNRYKAAKQPDVVMLVYLLGSEGLRGQLAALGYPYSAADIARTVDYYLARTSDGSTLSRVVHASVLAGIAPERAWMAFREALVADLDDTQGGTTREGIHLGAMAGTVDIPVRRFGGMSLHRDEIRFAPHLPPQLKGVEFQIRYRGHLLDVAVADERVRVRAHRSSAPPIRVRVGARLEHLTAGGTKEFSITEQGTGRRGR